MSETVKKQVQSISSFMKVFFKFFCEAPEDVKVKTKAEAESSFFELTKCLIA